MSNKSRIEHLEAKISTGEETVFETQTLQEIQSKLKNKPSKPFCLAEIQKKMSAKK